MYITVQRRNGQNSTKISNILMMMQLADHIGYLKVPLCLLDEWNASTLEREFGPISVNPSRDCHGA